MGYPIKNTSYLGWYGTPPHPISWYGMGPVGMGYPISFRPLAIDTIGILQNIFIASCTRRPEAFGFHIELVNTISNDKVSKVLAQVEE